MVPTISTLSSFSDGTIKNSRTVPRDQFPTDRYNRIPGKFRRNQHYFIQSIRRLYCCDDYSLVKVGFAARDDRDLSSIYMRKSPYDSRNFVHSEKLEYRRVRRSYEVQFDHLSHLRVRYLPSNLPWLVWSGDRIIALMSTFPHHRIDGKQQPCLKKVESPSDRRDWSKANPS